MNDKKSYFSSFLIRSLVIFTMWLSGCNTSAFSTSQKGKCNGGVEISYRYTLDLDNSGGDNIVGQVLGEPKNYILSRDDYKVFYESAGGYFVSENDVEKQEPGEWRRSTFITPFIRLGLVFRSPKPGVNSWYKELTIGGNYIDGAAEMCYETDSKGNIFSVYVRK